MAFAIAQRLGRPAANTLAGKNPSVLRDGGRREGGEREDGGR
jgi:hypothetical protein